MAEIQDEIARIKVIAANCDNGGDGACQGGTALGCNWTFGPELLQDLLRGQLGFNALILTDASHMAGMTTNAPRSKQVPGAIAAGADMYLYFNDHEEDFIHG